MDRPRFIYDGDCGICREWVGHWRALTGDAFEFRPYQEVAAEHPEIPEEAFRRSVQLVEPDGTVLCGAGATFALYRDIAPQRLLLAAWKHIPPFRALSEAAYGFLSRRRGLLAFITHLFWGRNPQPARFDLTGALFLRLLGLIYLSAFASFGVQARGLIGREGVLPLGPYLDALRDQLGGAAWYLAPSVFWLNHSDTAILAVCIAGALLAVLLVFNVLTRAVLPCLFFLYLSLAVAGQTFMSYQWDALLLEAGFLAIFLPSRSRLVTWLYRFLLFRYILLSGVVKILSADPAWDSLTALYYHFETQPLPTPLAWYAHHLPRPLLVAGTAATLVIELALPFLILCPRRLRMVTGLAFIVLQLLIIATGNYNFFNLLSIALCVFLFDDAALARLVPAGVRPAAAPAPRRSRAARWGLAVLAVAVLFAGTESALRLAGFFADHAPSPFLTAASACRCVNTYGPFAVMTTVRHEIVIEGTHDGSTWQAYRFRYKPEDTARIGGWIVPHQPRLDWQMWFAALARAERVPWFRNFMVRLLEGSPPVLALLAHDPFAGTPPAAVRARLYRYRFTDPATRAATGDWWQRTLVREYHPPIRLKARPEQP